ncbi:uncharacterized protein V1516DRAFT_679928 [Lipomyces oligophaga]|uniref:uncharacterized protein n=1 Tax=Lipomyces oligophaga TaxID=45792 RepID=UPI0034D00E40
MFTATPIGSRRARNSRRDQDQRTTEVSRVSSKDRPNIYITDEGARTNLGAKKEDDDARSTHADKDSDGESVVSRYSTRSTTRRARSVLQDKENIVSDRKRSLRGSSIASDLGTLTDVLDTPRARKQSKSRQTPSRRVKTEPKNTTADGNQEKPVNLIDLADSMKPAYPQDYSFSKEEAIYRMLNNENTLHSEISDLPDEKATQIIELDPNKDDNDNDNEHDDLEPNIPTSPYKWALFIPKLVNNLVDDLISMPAIRWFLLFLAGILLAIMIAKLFISSSNIGWSSTFEPPASLPASFEELGNRLFTVERNLEKMSATSQKLDREHIQYLDDRDSKFNSKYNQLAFELEKLILLHAQDFEKLQAISTNADTQSKQSLSEISQNLKNFEQRQDEIHFEINNLFSKFGTDHDRSLARIKEIDGKLMEMATSMLRMQDFLDRAQLSIDSHSKDISGQSKTISHLTSRIDNLDSRVDQALSKLLEQAKQTVVDAIDELLPEQVRVTYDENNFIAVPAKFWKVLESALNYTDEPEQTGISRLQNYFRPILGHQESRPVKYSWEDFISENQAQLDEYLDASINGWYDKLEDRTAFVSKAQFVELVGQEFEALKRDVVVTTHNSKEEIYQYVDTILEQRAGQPIAGSGVLNLTRSMVDSLVQEALEMIQESAEQKYDFADIKHGARVNVLVTSSTLDLYKERSLFDRAVDTIMTLPLGGRVVPVNAPRDALNSDLSTGNCWPFKGQEGTLGIKLAEWTYIDDIALNHVSKTIARDIRVAPKEFEFWVRIEKPSDRRDLQHAMNGVYPRKGFKSIDNSRSYKVADPEEMCDGTETLAPLTGQEYVMIGRFMYDINTRLSLQSFRFSRAVTRLLSRIPVLEVAFKFNQNWGSDVGTCVYKVLVHGRPVDQFNYETTDPDLYEDSDIGLGEDRPI